MGMDIPYHQGEARKPDCTFLPSAIARIQSSSQAVLPEAMVLLTSMTDVSFGMRSSTKSQRSYTWNGISTTASLKRRLESVYSTTKFRLSMLEVNSSIRCRTVLYWTRLAKSTTRRTQGTSPGTSLSTVPPSRAAANERRIVWRRLGIRPMAQMRNDSRLIQRRCTEAA